MHEKLLIFNERSHIIHFIKLSPILLDVNQNVGNHIRILIFQRDIIEVYFNLHTLEAENFS